MYRYRTVHVRTPYVYPGAKSLVPPIGTSGQLLQTRNSAIADKPRDAFAQYAVARDCTKTRHSPHVTTYDTEFGRSNRSNRDSGHTAVT